MNDTLPNDTSGCARLCKHFQGLFWKHSGTEWVTLNYRTVAEGQWAEKKRKKPHVSFLGHAPYGSVTHKNTPYLLTIPVTYFLGAVTPTVAP